MRSLKIFVAALIFGLAVGITVEKHEPGVSTEELEKVQSLFNFVKQLQDGVYDFWSTYGPDEEFGGFHTEVSITGVPTPNEPKSSIMQTRHLYTISKLFLTGRYPPEDRQRLIELMHSQFDWILENMSTSHTDELSYLVSADGKTVVNGEHRMYYTGFTIYGAAYYALACQQLGETEREKAALKFAIDNHNSVCDRLCDSVNGGYDQSREATWFFEYGMEAGGKYWWADGCHGANSYMHYLEALTPLYLASGDADIGEKLEELQVIYFDKLMLDRPYQPIVTYCNWTALSEYDVNFSHDIELAHLLQDAGEALNYRGISKSRIDQKVVDIVTSVADHAYDKFNGGLFGLGIFELGVTTYIKAFWAQAEAALGFWRAYLVSGDTQFLDYMNGTLTFYREYMLVPEMGEFYWEYNINLDPVLGRGTDLYDLWKTSYHNMRCFLTALDEMEAYLG
eukprot:TRINITY_DN773_c0_g1_i10.p1 TRINITY_DN773_c0_g1~~TRINITY_DN773_c0_g1_i10.p1  ORF type:complete len:486 (+),score=47.76 TRINITY_DN773_c0_g1_i10:103-1458(+)